MRIRCQIAYSGPRPGIGLSNLNNNVFILQMSQGPEGVAHQNRDFTNHPALYAITYETPEDLDRVLTMDRSWATKTYARGACTPLERIIGRLDADDAKRFIPLLLKHGVTLDDPVEPVYIGNYRDMISSAMSTPLGSAIDRFKPDMVEVLLDLGARPGPGHVALALYHVKKEEPYAREKPELMKEPMAIRNRSLDIIRSKVEMTSAMESEIHRCVRNRLEPTYSTVDSSNCGLAMYYDMCESARNH